MSRKVNRGDHRAAMWVRIYRWLARNGFEHCRLCGITENLTWEHILPVSLNGTDEISNITILCSYCNNSKGNEIYEFEPLVWPPPQFAMAFGRDIKVGDWLQQGIVVSRTVISRTVNKNGHDVPSVWACELDSRYAMVTTRWAGKLQRNERYLIVRRGFHEDFKRIFDRVGTGQAG